MIFENLFFLNLIYINKKEIQIVLINKCLEEDHQLEEAHHKEESKNHNISTIRSSNISISKCWRELNKRGSNLKFK